MYHVKQALGERLLTQVRELLATAQWADGRATAGVQSANVKLNLQLPEDSPAAHEAQHIVLDALSQNAQFFSAALPKRIFPPLFNRYQTGMRFGTHVDNAVRTHAASGEQIRTDMSATLFLSDPADYDGGELVIAGSPIKLCAGDMILYRADTLHEVLPITRGERVACFFWLQSLVRSHDQRALLHELDIAITSLRTTGGETNEAVRLTQCYHNLLRMWAEV